MVVNKIDRPDARPGEVEEEVLELLLDLSATDDQLDSPVVYCWEGRAPPRCSRPPGKDLLALFDILLDVRAARGVQQALCMYCP